MKKSVLCSFLFLFSIAHAEKFLIDRGEAVVFTEEGAEIITKSDTERMSLEGGFKTLDDVIMEKLMYQEAKKYKIEVDEGAVNRYIAEIQRQNNLPLEELMKMFTEAGYTYDEGRQQLGIMMTVNQLLDFKVRSQLIVPEKKVREYYEANPVVEDAQYVLRRAVVLFDTAVSRDEQRARIERQIKTGAEIIGAQWSQEFSINAPDIAESKLFIFDLKPGEISKSVEIAEGFELFELLDFKPERLVPFDERYREISELLRKPRFEELFEALKKELEESSSVVRF